VFTEPFHRDWLRNPVVPPLLGADGIENTASSIVACWTVFIELLPGNALIKSITVFRLADLSVQVFLPAVRKIYSFILILKLKQARWPNPFKVHLSLILKFAFCCFEVNVILKSPPPMMVSLIGSQWNI
jgi:hypothetical protein